MQAKPPKNQAVAGFFLLIVQTNSISMKTKNILFFPIAFLFVAFMPSCKKDNKSAPVQFLLTDKPASFDSVNVHIVGMEVQINHDTESWISIHTKDSVYNLLDLQNGITAVVAQDTIPGGVLQEVRFILGDGNKVVLNGVSYPLDTPSAEESGLKVKIGKSLNETLNTFTLDFDASLSIMQENGAYKLHPVIQMR
jgi:hypothetical protein